MLEICPWDILFSTRINLILTNFICPINFFPALHMARNVSNPFALYVYHSGVRAICDNKNPMVVDSWFHLKNQAAPHYEELLNLM